MIDSPFNGYALAKVNTSLQWLDVRTHIDCSFNQDWVDLHTLDKFNLSVNRHILYLSESEDEWQTPDETAMRKTGDCEDYAILKYGLLLENSVSEDDLMLIIGEIAADPSPRPHAFLLVKSNGKWLVLDSMFDKLIDPNEYINFKPIKAFTRDNEYLFSKTFTMNEILNTNAG
jgi:predicted transglutaminase-like cysteine proteinase